MTNEDYQWLQARENIMYYSVRLDTLTKQTIYDIYNRLTGEDKKPNGCGSCLRNTIRTVKHNYLLKKNKQ